MSKMLTCFNCFTACSQICIPLDSCTSTHPRYCQKQKYLWQPSKHRL